MIIGRFLAGLAALSVMAVAFMMPAQPAHARVFIGIGVPFPYVAPPPYYYPPPVYYPPPAYYPPPPAAYYAPPPGGPAVGGMCNAGSYTCPIDRPLPPGSACFCTGNNGQHIRGNVN
jgi:hypothetical protein